MRIKLEQRWTKKLLQWAESGMGYQRVDLRLDDGREICDVAVFNAEEVELPDEYADGRIAGIRRHSDGYRVPFLYSTSGEVHWFHDVRHKLNRFRQLPGFHTPEALREMSSRDFEAGCEWFRQNPNNHPRRIA